MTAAEPPMLPRDIYEAPIRCVIVLDEPSSALDVSVQADIVEVLLSLQADLGLI